MNTYSFVGSQFDDNPYQNIDPRLLRITREQTTVGIDQLQHTAPTSTAVSQWQGRLPSRPATPIQAHASTSAPNNQALSRQRPVIPDTPPSTVKSFTTPQHRRLLEVQATSRQHRLIDRFHNSHSPQLRPWQQDNRYAILDPDLYTQNCNEESTLAHDDPFVSNYTLQDGTPPQATFSVPPSRLEELRGLSAGNTSLRADEIAVPNQRSDGGTFISSETLSRLPVNPHSNESMGQWSQGTFQLTGGVPTAHLTPPTPPSSGRHRRKASRAPSTRSTSTHAPSFICDVCHKVFEKRHQLNHHYRWHEDPTHTCEECGRKFVAKKDVRRHAKIHKKEERHLFCTTIGCKYQHLGFHRPDHLKRHMERIHRGSPLSPPASSTYAGG